MLVFGSVCSGIEAASVAWEPLGWRPAWFAEVDRAASDVLAYRFPHVPNYGDMTVLAAKIRLREILAPDVLVGGTPCQAFSIAGLRGGLSDARGQLTLAFVLLADAIDEVRIADGKNPVIIVWENVPGVLNHKDNPFGCFLAGIAGESDALVPAGRKWTNAGAVLGPKRAIAWRVLDAQYFRLAQRRRRVFVVASARDGFDPSAVLLEFHGLRRDSPPSREAGQDVAGTLDARADGGGFPGTDGACANHVVPAAFEGWPAEVASTLNAHFGSKQGLEDQHVNSGCPLFVPAPCVAFYPTNRQPEFGNYTDVSPPPLTIGSGGASGQPPGIAYAIQERAVCENPAAGPDGVGIRADDCAYTLEARSVPQAVCITGDITHTLKADGFDASEDGTGRGQPIVAFAQNSRSEVRLVGGDGQVVGALAADVGAQQQSYLAAGMAVRRLMPVEGERLQGFPDNWTLVPNAKGKPAADGPRYKQLGNSMATHCMHWIGRRIQVWHDYLAVV